MSLYTKELVLSLVLLMISLSTIAKETVGWVEKVLVSSEKIEIKAKIDSGARHSSLHCGCVKRYKIDNQKWVDLEIVNYKGDKVALSKKVIRSARIKRHKGKYQIRDVIKLGVCLGSVYKEVEVNLIDRTGLNYKMLIGRSFLEDEFLIDSSYFNLNPPKCQ